jgi:hypothetical protein
MLEYKSKIGVLGPVAIKADQMEVHASWGEDWGAVRCPACAGSHHSKGEGAALAAD